MIQCFTMGQSQFTAMPEPSGQGGVNRISKQDEPTAAPAARTSVRSLRSCVSRKEDYMFRWAIIFAVVALVAALLGFGGIAGLSADFAKILLVVAVVLVVVGFVFGRGGRRTLP